MFAGTPLERGAENLQKFSFDGNEKDGSIVILSGWDRFALFQPNFAETIFSETQGFFESFFPKDARNGSPETF